MAGEGVGIGKARRAGDRAADNAPKVRTGAIGATLLERVAGGADLAHALTSRRVGGGEEGAEIDGERLRPGAGAGFRNRQDGLLDMGHVASKLGRVARRVHAGGPGALEDRKSVVFGKSV